MLVSVDLIDCWYSMN